MVEAMMIEKPQKLKMSDFCDHLTHKATGNDQDDNADLLAGEIESLESILTKQEVQTIEAGTKLTEDEIA
jgi:hypothetical protein